MWVSETKRFAPNGARIKFFTVVAYKHLAPNGAKTPKFKRIYCANFSLSFWSREQSIKPGVTSDLGLHVFSASQKIQLPA